MAYFKIDGVDFSMSVSGLKVATEHIYKGMTNAEGNLLTKYVNTKKKIEVSIIPLDGAAMAALQAKLKKFEVVISFLNPETQQLEEINCIVPSNIVEYYTAQTNKIRFKAFVITFDEK